MSKTTRLDLYNRHVKIINNCQNGEQNCFDCLKFDCHDNENFYKGIPSIKQAITEEIEAQQKEIEEKETPTTNFSVAYGTPWIEEECGWGDRPEGWRLFLDREVAIRESKIDSIKGNYSSGYIGPVRPLNIYEIKMDALEAKDITSLSKYRLAITRNYWSPAENSVKLVWTDFERKE